MEARIVNEPEEGSKGVTKDAELGERGELWLRGPNIMKVSFTSLRSTSCEFPFTLEVPQQSGGNEGYTDT